MIALQALRNAIDVHVYVYMYLHYARIIDAYVYHFRNRIFGYYYWKWNLPKLPGLSFGRYVGRLVGQFGGGS